MFESRTISHADPVRNPGIAAVKERLVRALKNLPDRQIGAIASVTFPALLPIFPEWSASSPCCW